MANYYHKSDVVDNLWLEFKKTPEYKASRTPLVGIRQDHSIVIRREEEGLNMLVSRLENELGNTKILYLNKLRQRKPADWVKEWLEYNGILFSRVLRKRGRFRQKNVWFDTLDASEKDYKIPDYRYVPTRVAELATEVRSLIQKDKIDMTEKLRMIAKIHFEFIRIHPFEDGNGRIGRLIVDQMCLAFSLPAMVGYPRADINQRRAYHAAIKDSCYDPDFSKLTQWIGSKLEKSNASIV